MYKHLYDKFKNWQERGSVYFYSDPHFGDEYMNELRGITDEEQIKRINSKLGKRDTLVILGDVGDIDCVKKLRGYKVLIKGNHDVGASKYERIIKQEEVYMGPGAIAVRFIEDNHLFDEVYEGALFISEKIVLSHEPIDFLYALNLHGHCHNGRSGCGPADDLHLNVAAECIDYTPVCLKHIVESGALSKIQSLHRETIDIATERKKGRD